MDIRAEKLAKARKKLKDHQEKKTVLGQKEVLEESSEKLLSKELCSNDHIPVSQTSSDTQMCQKSESCIEQSKTEVSVEKHFFENRPDAFTEMLIANKTNLEIQINELQNKLSHLEQLYVTEVSNHSVCKQRNFALQSEIHNLNTKYTILFQENLNKDEDLRKLHVANQILIDEKSNLSDQLEFTKSILTTKETENAHLNEEIHSYQSKLGLFQLQLQQLTTGSVENNDKNKTPQETAVLLEKITQLEQKIVALQHDKDHLSSHYEHYVRELNEQLKVHAEKNEDLSKDLEKLYNRENSLIEQISDMEIRLQNYNFRHDSELKRKESLDVDLQSKCLALQKELHAINIRYNDLQEQYKGSLNKIQELNKVIEERNGNDICKHDNVDLTKLTADIASDKLAAQRATEQNEQLKYDVQRLEQVIIKMGKDKLELTEMWTHEKQLNKGLSLKLAELEESGQSLQSQLKAKDGEMIRLINEYRELEKKRDIILKDLDTNLNTDVEANVKNENGIEMVVDKNNIDSIDKTDTSTINHADKKARLDNMVIQKEDAMMKLQERFLNIMDEVANLSDEKHRLEHIILQLQNETDTICEYVALYQQQRSLLKKREEERSTQLIIFQAECDKLKCQLEELQKLLLNFAEDEGLISFLKDESRLKDFDRVKELLEKLQRCSLINPKFNNLDLNIFYPCSCCSGQLIDI